MRTLMSSGPRQGRLRLAAVSLALVAATGCTTPAEPVPAASPTARVGARAATSPAAELQAALTALLVERAYVVAAATDAVAVADGRVSVPGTKAALDALDANSTALSDVLGASYSTARRPLLVALRREDRLLNRHAVALAAADAPGAAAVRDQLRAAQDELAVVVRRVVPQLDAAEVASGIGVDVQAQLARPSYDALRTAVQDSRATARLLAAGIAADRGLGSPTTEAALLRGDLTALLAEHAMLVGALARELRAGAEAGQSARAALDANAEALADVIGRAYPAARVVFLRSWLAHLDRLQRYAAARAAGDEVQRGTVDAYPAELARLLASHLPMLPARSSQSELDPALASLLDAVDAAATGSRDAPEALRAAVADQLPAAALISSAAAEDLRLR